MFKRIELRKFSNVRYFFVIFSHNLRTIDFFTLLLQANHIHKGIISFIHLISSRQ